LTNEGIAARLGVTHAAAKYHVSEILSKLGVATREEAAAWSREPAEAGQTARPGKPRLRRWWIGVAGWLRPVTVGKAALIAASVAVLGAMGVLAWGVLRESGEEPAPVVAASPTASPYVIDEQAAVDLVLHTLADHGAQPSADLFDVSVEQMLYGDAARVAPRHGLSLLIRPEDYSCPQYGGCPYPGEPADEPGWLIVVSRLGEYAPEPRLTRLVAWVGEGGHMAATFAP
jgi:hypothetical protein